MSHEVIPSQGIRVARIDRAFGWLLILASVGHTTGTVLWTQPMSQLFIWSLGASLAGLLLGALNIVRAGRPEDRTLAAITAVGTTGWALLALAFGISIGNVLDPRAMTHFIVACALVVFSVRTWSGRAGMPVSQRFGKARAAGTGS